MHANAHTIHTNISLYACVTFGPASDYLITSALRGSAGVVAAALAEPQHQAAHAADTDHAHHLAGMSAW